MRRTILFALLLMGTLSFSGCLSARVGIGSGLEINGQVGGLVDVGLGFSKTEGISLDPWRTELSPEEAGYEIRYGIGVANVRKVMWSGVEEEEKAIFVLPGLLSEYSGDEPYYPWHRWLDVDIGATLLFVDFRFGICPSFLAMAIDKLSE